ncbi:hypothetical protein SAMN04489712_105291 [Thermomonospora echinospora]|uniref:Holin n=1 Tax=Thermomonospora echinospora TaxID=1992 RepID=A0A1H6A9T3_9ACTN|nr:hypothetical protein [Thermomonospora echinospora]SEG45211.1 hypothetical protein SAMN04489712_105291 [Thermomonospora echinospora]
MRVSAYTKFIVAALAAVGVALNLAIGDDTLTTSEIVDLVLVGLGALGVYALPNRPAGPRP